MLGFVGLLQAQNDLRKNQRFFQNRSSDYAQWLSTNELGRFLKFENTQVSSAKVIIFLSPKFTGDQASDSLRSVWKDLRKQYYNESQQELHFIMLSKMSFQMEISLDSLEIFIKANSSPYYIRIYGEKSQKGRARARWEEIGDQSMGSGNIRIPVGQLKEVFYCGNSSLNEKGKVDLPIVRRTIQNFFIENYINRGTDWIWKARIDTSSMNYNEFSYTVTHISREVLKSHNYFELHQIDIRIETVENSLEVFWSFQAKFGGGFIFPPRDDSNDYHDFESSQYKDQFKKYQMILFKRLEAQFKKI